MSTTNTVETTKPNLKDTYSKDRWKKLKQKLKLC